MRSVISNSMPQQRQGQRQSAYSGCWQSDAGTGGVDSMTSLPTSCSGGGIVSDHRKQQSHSSNDLDMINHQATCCCCWRAPSATIARDTNRWPLMLAAVILVVTCQVQAAPTVTTVASTATPSLATAPTKAQVVAGAETRRPPPPPLEIVALAGERNEDEASLLLLITERAASDAQLATQPQNHRISSTRHLIKRSGISDQRLAEIQMIRALKKQLERASKLATINNENSANGASQQAATTSTSD